jgi:hypothetical protein
MFEIAKRLLTIPRRGGETSYSDERRRFVSHPFSHRLLFYDMTIFLGWFGFSYVAYERSDDGQLKAILGSKCLNLGRDFYML